MRSRAEQREIIDWVEANILSAREAPSKTDAGSAVYAMILAIRTDLTKFRSAPFFDYTHKIPLGQTDLWHIISCAIAWRVVVRFHTRLLAKETLLA